VQPSVAASYSDTFRIFRNLFHQFASSTRRKLCYLERFPDEKMRSYAFCFMLFHPTHILFPHSFISPACRATPRGSLRFIPARARSASASASPAASWCAGIRRRRRWKSHGRSWWTYRRASDVLRTGEQDNSPLRRTKSRSDRATGGGEGGGGDGARRTIGLLLHRIPGRGATLPRKRARCPASSLAPSAPFVDTRGIRLHSESSRLYFREIDEFCLRTCF